MKLKRDRTQGPLERPFHQSSERISLHAEEEDTGSYLNYRFTVFWASQSALAVMNTPAMQETQVQSLGREDPLEKEMATHSSIFA